MKRLDWEKMTSSVPMIDKLLQFVNNEMSAREMYETSVNRPYSGEVRKLIRGGASRAKQVTRKALKRRGLI